MQFPILHRLYIFYYASQHSNKRTPYKKFEEIMANRDILKEAIADAKAVKETAIANAKIALEEAFTPFLQTTLATRLAEMDMEEMKDEDDEIKEDYMDENMYEEDKNPMNDEIDLEELLRELGEMEEVINDPKGPGAHGNIAPSSISDTDLMEAEGEMEEEFDIESMSEEDLKSFIEDVISDMVKDGELEAGHEGMEDEEDEESEEEVDLDELLREMDDELQKDLKPDAYYEKHDAGDKASKFTRGLPKFKDSQNDAYYEIDKIKKEKNEMKEELDEAYKALNKIKSELNEINLLNSKLLYSNKVFKAKNLTESQKVKVLSAFDKATSKKEAQLVYETVMENLNAQTTTKRPMNESVRGMASRVIAGAQNTKQPIIEVNSAFERMQKLAGIRK
jgi:hypothetical protein